MIEYRKSSSQNTMKDGFSSMLRESAEYFASQGYQVVGDGFKDIISEDSMFKMYVGKLCEGLNADEAEQMGQLLDNTRTAIMRENSIAGITPISSLSMPTVRKMWVRTSLKNAVPTEPVKAPKFTISYMEPYMFGANGVKVSIPSSIRDMSNTYGEKTKVDTKTRAVPTADNLITEAAADGITVAAGDSIDPVFFIEYVSIYVAGTSGAVERKHVHLPLDLRGNVSAAIVGTQSSRIFANLNRSTGEFFCTAIDGKIKNVELLAYYSSENNKGGMSIGFDIATKDVTIGTGEHFNAPLGIEWLQDTMAMYEIDAALEVVDLMSNVVAQKLDQEIKNFLENSFTVNNGAPFGTSAYAGSFDCRPSAQYAGAPKDWREELKTQIDYWAIKMKNDSAFQGGKFVIIGNPIDVQIITNIDWTFNSSTQEKGGVDVDYSIGAFSGALRYEIVSSVNLPAGTLRMIYIPNTPKQMTFKYFPYTFNVEKGYIDPNRQNLPSLMMTKRHTIEELTPLQCVITITNNNGSMLDGLDRTWNTEVIVSAA
jgi:hypothetical protein